MGEFRIKGGRRLCGEVAVPGSKNAVLPILAATVLGKKSIIHNCPKISDRDNTIEILLRLGCDVAIDGRTIIVDAGGIKSHELPEEETAKMRSSIIFAGGLLGRFGKFTAYHPGGCKLGERPIDLHLEAFCDLGAILEDDRKMIVAKAKKLSGTKINLPLPSVGATQNAMLAATLADGITVIENAAKEPEIIYLQDYLISAGAKVMGAGSCTIVIEGVTQLHDAEYTISPDRIVAGTYLAAGAITGGTVRLKHVVHEDIDPIVQKLADMGAVITRDGRAINLSAPNRLHSLDYLATGSHPGFPTDMQPQLTALLATARGASLVNETVFEARYKHIEGLVAMGAEIVNHENKIFQIEGVNHLHGNTVAATDLRCGAALVLAGLAAKGETIVKDAVHIERGYEAIHEDLQALGADITLHPA